MNGWEEDDRGQWYKEYKPGIRGYISYERDTERRPFFGWEGWVIVDMPSGEMLRVDAGPRSKALMPMFDLVDNLFKTLKEI